MPKLAPRFALAAAIVWVMFFGGGKFVMGWMFERAQTWGEHSATGIRDATSKDGTDAPVPPAEMVQASATMAQALEEDDEVQILGELFERLRVRYNALDDRHKKLEAEHEQLLEQVRDMSALVAVTQDAVTFRSGYTYRIGDVIDYGEHKGRKLVAINQNRRTATLDNNTVLRLMRVVDRSGGVLDSVTGDQ
jgi:hypothetical protein